MTDSTSEPGDGLTPTEPEAEQSAPGARVGRWRRGLLTPRVIFPIVAAMVLSVLWLATVNLVMVERANARRAANASSEELLDTYEAQVVRVLREIDQTLKSIQYSYQLRGSGEAALTDLRDRDLLPPDLIFSVSVTDAGGDVVATTSPSAGRIAPELLALARQSETLTSEQLVRSGDEWRLRFGRGLTSASGSFGGIALVEVDASFFVSGYDPSKLGEEGVLALLGSDGVFRVRRTGDETIFGGRTGHESLVPSEHGFGDTEAKLIVNRWDGVRRYTIGRHLYDSSLAVVVGLSEEEQLALTAERTNAYLLRASAASVVLILVIVALGRMSWNLEKLRHRESEIRIAYAKRVEHLAYHDGLTGLPNRSFLNKLLEDRVRQASRYGSTFAVLFLDLDGFKRINDTLGHDAGDELLREVARRLERTLRKSDTVARMGGDEFVILLPQVDHEEQVAIVAQKVLSALKEPFVLLGEKLNVTVSVGASLFPRDGGDEQTLMKNADIALYESKDAGRNTYRLFSAEMKGVSEERLHLESSLRQALKNHELDLHYQARRDLDSNRVTGVEALLRWDHPQLGTLGPPAFLSLAEETGLILPIGRWVLRTACRQSVAWLREGLPRLNMAVNLSVQQFLDDGLLNDVAEALEESGMAAELLELEICESVLTRAVDRTLPILEGLKKLGVRITVDNFGTGYSSLSVLRHLPVDTIKTDRLFLRDDAGDAAALEVTNAIVSMGRTLSTSVVVQGVETKEQADLLRKSAGNQVQGFFFNRPVRTAAFTELLRAEEELPAGVPGRPARRRRGPQPEEVPGRFAGQGAVAAHRPRRPLRATAAGGGRRELA